MSQQKCWRKLTFGMVFLAMFAASSNIAMRLEQNNYDNNLWNSGSLEYTITLNFVYMNMALATMQFIDLWKIVRQDLSKSHTIADFEEK